MRACRERSRRNDFRDQRRLLPYPPPTIIISSSVNPYNSYTNLYCPEVYASRLRSNRSTSLMISCSADMDGHQTFNLI